MPFTAKSGKFNANINTRDNGNWRQSNRILAERMYCHFTHSMLPIENAPKVGIEITDVRSGDMNRSASRNIMKDVQQSQIWLRKLQPSEGVDFLSIRLEGGDPNGENKSNRGTDQLS